MSINNVFREVAIKNAQKQTVMVDAFTDEAPIYASLPMQPSSHPFTNAYEEINSVTGAVVTDVDGTLSTVDAQRELKDVKLKLIAGLMEVGESKAAGFGGPQAYFASKLPAILRRTGSNTEYDLLYNVIRKAAIDNGKAVSVGGSSGKNYSILCVKWTAGENIGLYSPTMFGNGKVFDMLDLGHYVKDNRVVYGMRVGTYFGVQIANPRNVSAIVNIDIDSVTTKTPIAAQIDDLIMDARGNPSNTMIYCHPKIYSHVLKQFKATQIQYSNGDQSVAGGYNNWDGIRIVTSYNFDQGDEGNVSV